MNSSSTQNLGSLTAGELAVGVVSVLVLDADLSTSYTPLLVKLSLIYDYYLHLC